jgi:hypothetical protein
MSQAQWMRDRLTDKGRDWTVQAFTNFKAEFPESSYTVENYVRQVKREAAKLRQRLEPEFKPPEAPQDVRDLDTSSQFFDVPENGFFPSKLTTNFWGNSSNPNHQFKAEWKPREADPADPEKLAEVFKSLTASYQPPSVKAAPAAHDGRTAILSVPDLHVGKIVWGKLTGSRDYSPEIAVGLYRQAVVAHLAYFAPGELREIVLPIGEDFFNIDNMANTTTKGTPQQNDDTFRMIETGLSAVYSVIEYCLMFAPVRVMMVSGNHDRLLSYMMGLAIEQRYRNVGTFEIDASPAKAKTYGRGSWAVMVVHPDKSKPRDLAFSFATQHPELWAAAKYREILGGHLHHNKEMVFLSDQDQGVKFLFLPSLCPADGWHTDKSFYSLEESVLRVYDDTVGHVFTAIFRPQEAQ